MNNTEKTADWMIWKDKENKIHVHCSECGHTLSETDPIPEKCPNCQSNMNVSIPFMDVIGMLYKH